MLSNQSTTKKNESTIYFLRQKCAIILSDSFHTFYTNISYMCKIMHSMVCCHLLVKCNVYACVCAPMCECFCRKICIRKYKVSPTRPTAWALHTCISRATPRKNCFTREYQFQNGSSELAKAPLQCDAIETNQTNIKHKEYLTMMRYEDDTSLLLNKICFVL